MIHLLLLEWIIVCNVVVIYDSHPLRLRMMHMKTYMKQQKNELDPSSAAVKEEESKTNSNKNGILNQDDINLLSINKYITNKKSNKRK
jgi:cell division protein FtsL